MNAATLADLKTRLIEAAEKDGGTLAVDILEMIRHCNRLEHEIGRLMGELHTANLKVDNAETKLRIAGWYP